VTKQFGCKLFEITLFELKLFVNKLCVCCEFEQFTFRLFGDKQLCAMFVFVLFGFKLSVHAQLECNLFKFTLSEFSLAIAEDSEFSAGVFENFALQVVHDVLELK